MPHAAIRAILFDKDGTLIDFNGTWGPAAWVAMQTLAAGDSAVLARLVEVSDFDVAREAFRPASPLVAGSSAQWGPLWARVLGHPSEDATSAGYGDLLMDASLRLGVAPIGDVRAVLAGLDARGLPLGIATNDSEGSARLQMDRLGIADLVGFVAGYDSGYGSKPDPGMVSAFVRDRGLRPHEVALVGDSRHDLVAARAAGVVAVAVLTGPSGEAARAGLAPFADVVLGSIADLDDWLDGSSGERTAVPEHRLSPA